MISPNPLSDIEKPRPREGNYLAQGHTAGWSGSQEQGTSKTLHIPPTRQHKALGVTFNLLCGQTQRKIRPAEDFIEHFCAKLSTAGFYMLISFNLLSNPSRQALVSSLTDKP